MRCATPGGAVRVRIFNQSGDGEVLVDRIVELQQDNATTVGGRPLFPGYGEMAMDASLHNRTLNPKIEIAIKVEPVAPTTRFWAMASMTRNDTNAVTLVTPEP